MKNSLLLQLFLVLIITTNCQRPGGKGGGGKTHQEAGASDELYGNLMNRYQQLLQFLTEDPEKLEAFDTKYNIMISESILTGLISTHIINYKTAIEQEQEGNGNRILQSDTNGIPYYEIPAIKESKNFLNQLLLAIFGSKLQSSTIDAFDAIMSSQFMKKQNENYVLKLDDVVKKQNGFITDLSQNIMKFYKSIVYENDDQYLEELDSSIERVVQYFIEYRKLDRSNAEVLLSNRANLSQVTTLANKYMSDKKFQQAFNDILDSDDSQQALDDLLDNDELLEQLFEGDKQDWDQLSQQAEKYSMDTQELETAYKNLQEYQQKKKLEREQEKKENENKKHDKTVLLFLGGVVICIGLFCIGRYLRKKKLQKDAYQAQGGYHQNL